MRAELVGAGIEPCLVDDAILVLTELVGNAVLHGRPLPDGEIRITWITSAYRVEVAITDGGGTTVPAPRPMAGLALSGRGLGIVAELAAQWGVRQERDHSTIWAILEREPVSVIPVGATPVAAR